MQIQHLKIRNILGISDLEIKAGKLVQISGRNGSGKTSVLEAIKSVLKGGTDATLLRKGEDKGEAVIVLDNGVQITKTVTASTSSTVAVGADGKKIPKPAETVKALTDMMSVNPIDFLRATKKERVNVLLESLPLEIDLTRIGIDPENPGHIDTSLHPLVLIEAVKKHIYDDRTGLNRAVKEKRATISQLKATLPEGEAALPGGADGLLATLDDMNKAKDAELERISTKLGGLRDKTQTDIDAVRTVAQTQIDELQRQIEAIRTKASDDIEALKRSFSEIEGKANAQRQRTVEKHAADTNEIRANLAAIQEAQKAAAKHEQTRETVVKMDDEAQKLQEQADKQTDALEAIEAYKSELLASLPIPGLEVRDGEIFRDDVPFDRLNTAQQVQIAVEIAKLRAGELGVCCVDGLELLDSGSYEEFCNQAASSGLQLFITRVTDTDFQVKSVA